MFEQALPRNAKKSLASIGRSGLLKDAYLAGGTALALQIGHRISVDLDFFTTKTFDSFILGGKLEQKIPDFTKDREEKNTLLGVIGKTKFSLFHYAYPLIAKTTSFLEVPLASIQDIAAMKIAAIAGRGIKRDFIDLYFVIHEEKTASLEEVLMLYDKKFKVLQKNAIHIFRSLTFFEEADQTKMPEMLKVVEWKEVKKFFTRETKHVAKQFFSKI
ncbi:nucleotidyl transferase AbiEii/AbiGii toxin family protein [Candidatus Parcubacteria bacterium]|nr:nucleotidyl transferase AbiEii/AbiGii toxin family protein [Candidatus Parcubacteria bacterium]